MFAPSEISEIVRLLNLPPNSDKARLTIEFITEHLGAASKRLRSERDSEVLEMKRLYIEARRGRPRGQGIQQLADCWLLASIYQTSTGAPIKNSRSGDFFKLAKICLRRADPSQLIAAIRRPPWNLRPAGSLPDGLADARLVVCKAIAEALRPDPE
jgi:hypothetical protein